MGNISQVRVVRRGVITLPRELRERNNIEEGDIITLIELGDGVVIMSPRRSHVDVIADKLAAEWQESGETLKSMLAALREARANMTLKNLKVFLDTSVVFAAVLSPSGGVLKLFQLGEAGVLRLYKGSNILRECEAEAVWWRKNC